MDGKGFVGSSREVDVNMTAADGRSSRGSRGEGERGAGGWGGEGSENEEVGAAARGAANPDAEEDGADVVVENSKAFL